MLWLELHFTRDMVAPLATVFAGLVAVSVTGTFAWLQVRYAREKLRLDLFDRRIAVLNAAVDAFRSTFQKDEDIASALKALMQAKHASEFLFPIHAGVSEIANRIHGDVFAVGMSMKSTNPFPSEMLNVFHGRMLADVERLKEAMRPYLQPDRY